MRAKIKTIASIAKVVLVANLSNANASLCMPFASLSNANGTLSMLVSSLSDANTNE